MFDIDAVVALDEAVDVLCAQSIASADSAQTRMLLRRLQSGIDRLEAVKATGLDHLEETGAFADDGASSSLSWARRELRLNDGEIKKRRASGRSMRLLPELGDAARAGDVRLDHVAEFTAGITKVGLEQIAEATPGILLPLARVAGSSELAKAIGRLEDVVHPERLDEQFKRGMDKHDVTLTKCGSGYHLIGFLDIPTGAKVATWLAAASAPRDADDDRTGAQRRLDAIGDLVDTTLRHGMPSDRGVRPQLHVMVEAAWLAGEPGVEGPTLSGFGPVGPELFGYLTCEADVTPVLVDGVTSGVTPQADVLNVGRASRLATPKQRVAVLARQLGSCAAPGCRHTVLEIHHTSWWARDGGRTDIDELVGLCSRCHSAVHAGRLHVAPDGRRGFVFRRGVGTAGGVLEDHTRVQRHRLGRYLRALSLPRGDPPDGPRGDREADADGPLARWCADQPAP